MRGFHGFGQVHGLISVAAACGLALALGAACGEDAPVVVAAADADDAEVQGVDTVDAVEDADADAGEVGPELGRGPWQRFEAVLDRAVGEAHPFDPAAVDVTVTFEAPDGATWDVPAFVYQGFARTLEDGRERLAAAGGREWRVRFRPPMGSPGGTWRWRWRATGSEVGAEVGDGAWQTFEPMPAGAGSHGRVGVSAVDPRYLAYEDGASYFAIGENLGWAGARGTFDYDDWMERLAAAGGNYIRVWMPSWGMGLEWEQLGDYGGRLDRAWQLDHVLERAEALGIQVMLTLQNHGPFSTVHASEWEGNPYNAANGGPLASPTEVLSNADARGYFLRRIRYIVARWASSPSVLAWELWNELDLVTDPASPAAAAWTEEMVAGLRALDPSHHLVTTSIAGAEVLGALLNDDLASLPARYPFWSLPELDLTQLHLYSFAGVAVDFARDVPRLAGYLRGFGKPALVAECGVSAVSADDTLALDPDGVGFHDILWSGLFAGTFGTGMAWWWDGLVDPQGYYTELRPLADLVADVAFDREGFALVDGEASAPGATVAGHALRGSGVVLAWVKNAAHQWFGEDLSVVAGARFVVPGVAAGRWEVRWIDPHGGGGALASVAVDVGGDGRLALEVPAFARDLAARARRVGP